VVEVSCAFATSLDTPEHIVLAERLGYRRAWCYDSPALMPDVWMTLARAAERTERIGLGPGVLIPNLRHVLTNATAIATLAALAPGRVVAGVGAGLSGRRALGQRPLRWRDVGTYLGALRGLLRGEEVEWEGAVLQMLQLPGFAAPRPVEVPLLVAAEGPKGLAVARERGDGLFTLRAQGGFPWVAQLVIGTVLDPGEAPDSARALAAAGPFVAAFYHMTYADRGWGDLDALPNGGAYRRLDEQVPARTRHLAVHAGYLVAPNALDQAAVPAEVAAGALGPMGLAADAAAWRARLAAAEQEGVTEIVFQPAGPDLPRELRAFAAAAGL
jgi:5,10-methylenetetrahydromethanopterin reductase